MVVLESITEEINAAAAAKRRSSRPGSRKKYPVVVDIVAGSMASAVIYGGHEIGAAVARQPSVTRNVFIVLMPLVLSLIHI